MKLEEAIEEIRSAPNRHRAMAIANDVAMASQKGQRDAGDEAAVRAAWFERWGHEPQDWGYCGPRTGANWTGD